MYMTVVSLHTDVPTVTQPLASSSDDRDSDYYVVRTVPPIVGVALIVVTVVMFVVAWWYCRGYMLRRRRKGMYKCKLSHCFQHVQYFTSFFIFGSCLFFFLCPPLTLSPSVSGAESGSDFELK